MANFGWAPKNFGSRTAYGLSPPKILGHGPPMIIGSQIRDEAACEDQLDPIPHASAKSSIHLTRQDLRFKPIGAGGVRLVPLTNQHCENNLWPRVQSNITRTDILHIPITFINFHI